MEQLGLVCALQGSEDECTLQLNLVAPAFHSSKQQKNEMAVLHLKTKLVVLLSYLHLVGLYAMCWHSLRNHVGASALRDLNVTAIFKFSMK